VADAWQYLVIAIFATVVMVLAGVVQSTLGLTSAVRLRELGGEAQARQRTVQSLVDPRRILAASMVLLQVLAAIVATGALIEVFTTSSGDPRQWLAMFIVGLVYLVFGIALPRALATRRFDRFVAAVLRLGHLATKILTPLNWLVERTAELIVRILPGPVAPAETFGFEEELRARLLEADDTIGVDEREMIEGILSLEEMTARDIMVPRVDIVAVDRTIAPRELIDIIVKAGHSRIPVYQESIDHIIGVLYAKDLLQFVIGNTIRIPLLDLFRPAFVVPESKRLNVLFAEMRRNRIHLAIVADEYGGTAGLVSIEDVLEEIVGEIEDEFDTAEWLFDQPAPDQLLADGRLPIEDVEDTLDIQFEEDDDFGTLGGFVHKHLGRLPKKGDAFEAEGVRVEIIEVERLRIRKLLVTRLPPPEDPDDRRDRRNRQEPQEDADVPSDDQPAT
jgi:putative hemolysin